jgi:intein/homing endonuclease
MVRAAKKYGMRACGLTDHGTFAGAIEFLRTCREHEIKPILGMEAYLAQNHKAHSKEGQPSGRRGNRHINLIAKNYVGYQNVCTLSQIASLDGFYYDPRLDAELLAKYSEGVIATSACFIGDQLVNTNRGLLPISDLSLSDYVLNSSGKYVLPVALTKRAYRGNLYTIYSKGHFAQIQCTEDHRFLVEKDSIVQWVSAKNLDRDCRLLTPLINEVKSVSSLNLWSQVNDFYFRKSKLKGISKEPLYISPDLCFFCGLWLAEGHVSAGGRVGFTFNSNEQTLAKFVSNFVHKQFGLEASIIERPKQHRIDVSICSEELKRFLLTFFGNKADGKFIYHWFKQASERCRINLLRGILLGDGSTKGKSFGKYDKCVYASISRSLTSDVRDLALSLKIRVSTASVRDRVDSNNVRHRKSYYLFAYGQDARSLKNIMDNKLKWKELDKKDSRGRKIGKNTRFIEFEDDWFFSVPILNTGKMADVSVDVFCLSEPTSESFCVDGVIVHNCLSNIVNTLLADDKYEKAKQATGLFKDIYGGDYYLEMMFHGIHREAKILPDILKLSKEVGVKVIVTNDCLLPDSLVLTFDGYKRVDSITKKDLVVTHKGRLRPVEHVNQELYDGELYKIYSTLGSFPISCTSNHPILIHRTKGAGWLINGEPKWVKAQEVNKGDLLCVPKSIIEFVKWRNDFEGTFNIPKLIGDRWYAKNVDGVIKSCRTDKAAGVPASLRMDRHFCQVLGLFLAEGYIDGTIVGFGLHRREHVLRDIICSYFEKYNFHPTVTTNGNGITVRVNSFVFAAVLENIVGKGASVKRLPSNLLLSESEMKTVIRYYLEGDGSMNSNGKTYMVGSCSEKLIWELSDLLKAWDILSFPTKRDGKSSSLRHPGAKSIWNDLFVLNFSGVNLDRLNELFGIEYSGRNIIRGSGHRSKFMSDDSYFYVRVKNIEKSWHTDKVWNIQVAEDESYVCAGYAVHNCHYVNKEDAEFHEVVMCISSGKTLKDPKRLRFPYSEFYFKSKEEMAKIFGHEADALRNTLEIAEKCDYSDIIFVEEGGTMKLPKFDIPPEFNDPYDYLYSMAQVGLVGLGLDESPQHVERLKTELSDVKLIWDTKRYDFATYFLIVQDIMEFARKNGIDAGVRGSGYGSLLLKCIGVVEGAIDPLEYDLLWERFLGFDSKVFFSENDFGIPEPKTQISPENQKG